MRAETPDRFAIVADRAAALAFCARYFTIADGDGVQGIVLRKAGETAAATLYHDFNGVNVWAHIVGKPGTNWLNRSYLQAIFSYPFVQLGARRVSLWIEATNLASRRFAEHLGFHHEATHVMAGKNGVDVCVYALFREDCRYA